MNKWRRKRNEINILYQLTAICVCTHARAGVTIYNSIFIRDPQDKRLYRHTHTHTWVNSLFPHFRLISEEKEERKKNTGSGIMTRMRRPMLQWQRISDVCALTRTFLCRTRVEQECMQMSNGMWPHCIFNISNYIFILWFRIKIACAFAADLCLERACRKP